jgi:hypothetical protein
MKIENIRIGMEVKSSGNAYCTYFVTQIGPKDKVTVEFRKGCRNYGNFGREGSSQYTVYASQLSPVKSRRKAPAKVPAAPSIESRILKILEKGTRIVRFEYNGKLRNVLIGTSDALDEPRWGKVENRAIRSHNGKKFLIGIDNLDNRQIKSFELSKIENPSF